MITSGHHQMLIDHIHHHKSENYSNVEICQFCQLSSNKKQSIPFGAISRRLLEQIHLMIVETW
jgi:hypothetical protein